MKYKYQYTIYFSVLIIYTIIANEQLIRKHANGVIWKKTKKNLYLILNVSLKQCAHVNPHLTLGPEMYSIQYPTPRERFCCRRCFLSTSDQLLTKNIHTFANTTSSKSNLWYHTRRLYWHGLVSLVQPHPRPHITMSARGPTRSDILRSEVCRRIREHPARIPDRTNIPQMHPPIFRDGWQFSTCRKYIFYHM